MHKRHGVKPAEICIVLPEYAEKTTENAVVERVFYANMYRQFTECRVCSTFI